MNTTVKYIQWIECNLGDGGWETYLHQEFGRGGVRRLETWKHNYTIRFWIVIFWVTILVFAMRMMFLDEDSIKSVFP